MFVCYAHRDSQVVYSDLIQLRNEGINLWYDEGIQAGSSWRSEIASAIKGATKLLFFISESSLKSAHCLREIDYALSHDIEIVPVYLENVDLPDELALVLNRVHALFRETDSLYMEHLLGALQKSARLAPLTQRTRKRHFTPWIALLAVAVGLSVLIIVSPWKGSATDKTAGSLSTAAPTAYDQYLEGLSLMERWDKDDNLETATALFREATTIDPGFALAFARLADALRMRYSLTREAKWLEEAETKVKEAVRLNAGLAPIQVALGRIHMARGNLDLAFAALERAVLIDPNDPVANQAMASLYERLGRFEDAEAMYRKALSLDPDNISTQDDYAHFLFFQGRFDDAVRQWQAVIRLAPDHFAALVNLGSALNEAGRIPEAITVYERAIAVKPTYMAYSNLGTAFSRNRQYPEAIYAYKKAIEIDDSDWLVWGNLAQVYSWNSEADSLVDETFRRAIGLAEAARQEDLRDPYAHSDLALYYARTGQPELSLQRLDTAILLSPESGEILAAAAEVYELLGQRTKAIEFANQSFEHGYTRQKFSRNPEMSGLMSDPGMQPRPAH
jgi:serine/threonine-protein kinase